MQNKKRTRASVDTGKFILIVFIIVVLNFIGSFFFKRIDLTAEKRYSLSPITLNFLDTLNDVVFVKVYLEGDFDAKFEGLRNSAKAMLDDFRTYSHKNIEYEFVNPYEGDKKTSDELQRLLVKKGMMPHDLRMKSGDGSKSQWIFPGAIISYRGKETVWQIYRAQEGIQEDVSVNNSVIELEYGLANSIRKLVRKKRPVVAFIDGHDELDTNHVSDFASSLSEYYNVVRININGQFQALSGVDAIVVAQPDSAFNDKDKYIIDQFVVKGGKALWCIDQMNIFEDSLKRNGITFIQPNNLNLTDLFFKYGLRCDPALIQDLQCGLIKLNTGIRGGKSDFRLYPWVFKNLVIPLEKDTHRITKNLEYVKLDYAGAIDTNISSPGLRKTILLHSSRYSRIQGPNTRIGFNMVKMEPNPRSFNNPYKPVAVLVEGKFSSMFTNHIPARIDSLTKFKAIGEKESRVIVISDGDIAENIYSPVSGFYPLGYDRDMNQTFANKVFLLNCVNYLLDDDGFMTIRNKNVKLRLLNKNIVKDQKQKWSLINLIIPLLFIAIIGVIQFFLRKARYTT